MIDFHVHLLPGVDDGARNTKMSIAMLKESVRQGVETIVATPHCYFDKPVAKLIKKRDKAYDKLLKACEKENIKIPKIIKGFEVHLSEKILDEENLDSLTIDGTNTMLVEMPMKKWNDEIFSRVEYLIDKGYDLVFAHPERYYHFEEKKAFDRLFSYGFKGQVNAPSFINPASREIAFKLIQDGHIAVMGSDAHNTGKRAVFLEIASEFISRNVGEKYVEMLKNNGKEYLGPNV